MLIRIAVADENEEYLGRLVRVLEEYKDLSLSVYTDRSSLEKSLVSRSFDILLFGSGVYDGQVNLKKNMLAVMLWDEEETVSEACRSFPKINKYQRISSIYKQILELYADICQDVGGFAGRNSVASIAFYSPAGGSGKTTLALTAATKLAMLGYKTFYINFEDMASEDCYLPQDSEKGLSELAVYLNSEINFPMKLQSLLHTKTDHLYYLNHFESPNDIYAMTEQEMGELLLKISRSELFDYVVVDMGVALDAKALSVFEQVQKIVLVEKPDAIASHKMKRFMEQTHIMNLYKEKMVRVLNFDNGQPPENSDQIPLAGKVGRVQNPDSAQLITMLATSQGAGFVNALIR